MPSINDRCAKLEEAIASQEAQRAVCTILKLGISRGGRCVLIQRPDSLNVADDVHFAGA